MGSVHGTCQRVNATPLMIDWIFNIGVVKNSRKYIYVNVWVWNYVAIVQLMLWRVLFSYMPGDWSHVLMEFIWHSRCNTIRAGTPGEPRGTISRQHGLAPRRTGSKWAFPEVTHSVWFWWIWWTILPFRSQSQTGHWVSVNPFHSTLLGCISILSAVDMQCGRQGLGTRRVYQTGLGSFRRLKYSWHSIGRVRSPKQSGRITLMHMVSMVAGQEVWAEPPDKHVMANGRMFIMKGFKTRATSPARLKNSNGGSTY